MLAVNAKVIFRTNGRGVTRVWKGTIKHVVKAGTLPESDTVRACIPHGNKKSNRDRYIVLLDETRTLMWANIKTTVAQGKKLPKHKPRLAQDSKKRETKTKERKKMNPAEKLIASGEVSKSKRSGGRNKKTTWYSIVDGKIVSQRKVICPPGYFKDKPVNGEMDLNKKTLIKDGNVVPLK